MSKYTSDPFHLLHTYFKKRIYTDYEKFLDSFKMEGNRIHKIDHESKAILILKDLYNEGEDLYDTIKFEKQVKLKISKVIEECIARVDNDIKEVFHESARLNGYVDFYTNKLNSIRLENSFKDFNFSESLIKPIESLLDGYKRDVFEGGGIVKSFEVYEAEGQTKHERAKKLYRVLEKFRIIDADEQEFIASFTGGEVINGIKWILQSPNHSYYVVGIFHLIAALSNKGYLSSDQAIEPIQYISYVFRNENGHRYKADNLYKNHSDFKDSKLKNRTLISALSEL